MSIQRMTGWATGVSTGFLTRDRDSNFTTAFDEVFSGTARRRAETGSQTR